MNLPGLFLLGILAFNPTDGNAYISLRYEIVSAVVGDGVNWDFNEERYGYKYDVKVLSVRQRGLTGRAVVQIHHERC